METLKITRVSFTDKKKDGTILEGKYGTFFRVGIQTEQYPDVWINGFTNKAPQWQEGDEVTLELTEEEWNGQMQKKFRVPKGADVELADKDKEIAELKAKLGGDELPIVNRDDNVEEDDDSF